VAVRIKEFLTEDFTNTGKGRSFQRIANKCTIIYLLYMDLWYGYTAIANLDLQHLELLLLPRDALLSPGVRLSVRPSRWWIVSRRLNISSNFLFGPVAPSV